jgi:hypothetical protein
MADNFGANEYNFSMPRKTNINEMKALLELPAPRRNCRPAH